MTENDWLWQVILPVFFLGGLTVMLVVVFRGGGPRRFGPRVWLPRHLTREQEKRIERFLLMGNRAYAIRTYATMTGADEDESAYAIDHWGEREC